MTVLLGLFSTLQTNLVNHLSNLMSEKGDNGKHWGVKAVLYFAKANKKILI